MSSSERNEQTKTVEVAKKPKKVADKYSHTLYRNNIFQKKLEKKLVTLTDQSNNRLRTIDFNQFQFDSKARVNRELLNKYEVSDTRLEQKSLIKALIKLEKEDLEEKAKSAKLKYAKLVKDEFLNKKSVFNYLRGKYLHERPDGTKLDEKTELEKFLEQEDDDDLEYQSDSSDDDSSTSSGDDEDNVDDEISDANREEKQEETEPEAEHEDLTEAEKDPEVEQRTNQLIEELNARAKKNRMMTQKAKFMQTADLVSLETMKIFSRNIDNEKFIFKKKTASKTPTAAAPVTISKEEEKTAAVLMSAAAAANGGGGKAVKLVPSAVKDNEKEERLKNMKKFLLEQVNNQEPSSDLVVYGRLNRSKNDNDGGDEDTFLPSRISSSRNSDERRRIMPSAMVIDSKKQKLLLDEYEKNIDMLIKKLARAQQNDRFITSSTPVRRRNFTYNRFPILKSDCDSTNTFLYALKMRNQSRQLRIQTHALRDKRFVELVGTLDEKDSDEQS